jgi:hypothetical protein
MTEAPTAAARLKSLEFLAGRWVGEGESADFGQYRDSYVFQFEMDGHFLSHRYAMEVGGKEVWSDRGMTGWDPDRGAIVNFAFGCDGSIGSGASVPGEGGTFLVMEGTTTGESPFKRWRTRYEEIGDDQIGITVEMLEGEQYVESMMTVYTRLRG